MLPVRIAKVLVGSGAAAVATLSMCVAVLPWAFGNDAPIFMGKHIESFLAIFFVLWIPLMWRYLR